MSEHHLLKAAIIVVSDTAHQDPSTDQSQTILAQVFSTAGNDRWDITHNAIVPDDVLSIQTEVVRLCDEANSVNLILTTGGTGFSAKDQTPEAISLLLDRHAPGLV